MPATLELKYFNTFWLKKIDPITAVTPSTVAVPNTAVFDSQAGAIITITAPLAAQKMNVGQQVTWGIYSAYIVSRTSDTVFTLNEVPNPVIPSAEVLTFGKIINFDNIPEAYEQPTNGLDWYIEEARIRGGYNNRSII